MMGWTRSLALLIAALAAERADAAGCELLPRLGAGRVAAIIDAVSIRLDDGRDVKLAGLTKLAPPRAADVAALSGLLLGRGVILHGGNADPDRHGRQSALLYRSGEPVPVQALLLQQGWAVAAGDLGDQQCRDELAAAESSARAARLGYWADPAAIKNPENLGDILARLGQFTVIEGRVVSVRTVGATAYVNFGRRWTQDFAVTISRQQVIALEGMGLALKALDGRWLRVRGFVGKRYGPQIEIRHLGQIEVIGNR
jgi:hypothetical protein